MVRLQLWIKAELENVTALVPATEDFEYFFKAKCNSCNEVHPKLVSMNRKDKREVTGSKNAKANFVWRCGLCKRESSATFEPTPTQPYTADNAQFAPFLIIECRGLEFIGFDPKGIWKCKGSNGLIFPDVDLSDGEWNDYDEKAALPVGVTGLQSEWHRA